MTFFLPISPPAAADDDGVSEYLTAAEEAISEGDYLRASSEYANAAQRSSSAEVAQEATRFAHNYSFDKDALKSAKRWVKLDKTSDEALLYLAISELRNGDIRGSRNSFRKILERGEPPADKRLVSLLRFLSDEDPQDADALMRQLSSPYKDSAYANYAAAVLALYAGDSDEAAARSKLATELKPDWLEPHLLYARSLLMGGDQDAAIDYTARLVGDTADPDPEARLELAVMYLSAGRDDDALSQVNQVLLEQPNRSDALRLMAIINFRLENLDAAWQDFEDLLASGHYTMDALYYMARIADHRGEYQRAIALYVKVIDGDNAVASQRRVGGILAEQDKFDDALRHLEDFGSKHPAYAVEMFQAQAQFLASEDRFDEALEYFDLAVAYRPDSEGTLLGKGELLLRMDRVDDSISVYREAVSRWPDSAMSLNALGYTLADRTDKHKEAEKLIKKALKLDPESPAIIDSYGWVLYRQGRYEKALAELERAYQFMEDPEIASHIIEVLLAMGREPEAVERLTDAEELWPESPLLERIREQVAPDE